MSPCLVHSVAMSSHFDICMVTNCSHSGKKRTIQQLWHVFSVLEMELTFSDKVLLGRAAVVAAVEKVVVREDGVVRVAQDQDASTAKVILHSESMNKRI